MFITLIIYQFTSLSLYSGIVFIFVMQLLRTYHFIFSFFAASLKQFCQVKMNYNAAPGTLLRDRVLDEILVFVEEWVHWSLMIHKGANRSAFCVIIWDPGAIPEKERYHKY